MDVYSTARDRALNNGRLFHVAAILWRNKTPVYLGVNSHKTHPLACRHYPNGDFSASLHAEMAALRGARPGDVLEVLRFTKSGRAMAKPCKYCQEHIEKAGVRVRYTGWDGNWYWLN